MIRAKKIVYINPTLFSRIPLKTNCNKKNWNNIQSWNCLLQIQIGSDLNHILELLFIVFVARRCVDVCLDVEWHHHFHGMSSNLKILKSRCRNISSVCHIYVQTIPFLKCRLIFCSNSIQTPSVCKAIIKYNWNVNIYFLQKNNKTNGSNGNSIANQHEK